jgi:predicted enzyme related to lactoylglutathione lyase
MNRVIHFEIHADDLDRAEAFYTGAFDWVARRWEGGETEYRLLVTGPDDKPGINGAIVPRRRRVDGQAVISFVCTIQVEDLDATTDRVVARGGTRIVEPRSIAGVGRFAYFRDTEGNVFSALQPA